MRIRGGLPLVLFLVLLVGVPILEVWLLIQVGQRIGPLATVVILVVEAALGGWLMRREGTRAWKALVDTFETGRVPTGQLADAALVLVGGLLLMLPGFATDVVGLLFLLPATRPLARRIVTFFIARRMSRLGVPAVYRQAPGEVIEGETVDGPAPGPASPADHTVIRGEVER